MSDSAPVFLTARWTDLVMVNWAVDPDLLQPFVPAGTELDHWQDRTLMSVVAFRFQDTRLKGVPIPFHRHFEELNLRIYVRREAENGPRLGVVFIKEVVPRLAIALVARRVYGENYEALPMHHQIWTSEDGVRTLRFEWLAGRRPQRLEARTRGEPELPPEGSEPSFLSEHYWGYTRQADGSTLEYAVEHPRWHLWTPLDLQIEADWSALYDAPLAAALEQPPTSAFVADGSEVTVRRGVRI